MKVKIKVLNCFDAFELFYDPASGCEVFSSTLPLKKNLTDNQILQKLVDMDQPGITKEELELSMYFRNRLLSGTLDEKEYLRRPYKKSQIS